MNNTRIKLIQTNHLKRRMNRSVNGQWISYKHEPGMSFDYREDYKFSTSWLLLHITQTKRNTRKSYGKGFCIYFKFAK
jgi:hypothetical protein